MKKSTKRIMISTLLGAFALCSTLSITNLASASANAVTIDTVSSFEMMDGASVRLDAEDPGIRFSATMSVEEYQGLVETYGAKNVEFGTFIMSASYESKVDSIANSNVYFGANPTFGWYVDDTTYVGGQTQILQMDSAVYEYTDKKTNETFMRVNGAVNEILPQNLMREYVGVSYIKVTEPTTSAVKYKMATLQADRARTIIYVTQKATDDPEYEASKTVLEDFVSDYVNYYKEQNGGNAPTVSYSVDVYDHDTYVETLSGEEYTVALNGTATYEVPSENIEYLDEEKSVLSARALANDKTVLKVVYNKTNHTPSSYSYNKGENPMWTCACGHEESMTAQAYRDYVANIYSFNSEDSKDLLTFAGDNAETAFNNTVYADGKLTNVSISTKEEEGTRSAVTIDLGGFYKVEDIVNVTVNITVDTAGTNNDWLDATLNHAGTITDDAKLTRPAVSGSSYKTAKVTETGELSLVIEQANILMNSAFTENTVLNTLTLGFASVSKSVVISIDSIEFLPVLSVADKKANLMKMLQFNSSNSMSIVSGGYNTAIATESTQSFTGLQSTLNSGSYAKSASEEPLSIDLGGFYTVGEIETITITLSCTKKSGSNVRLGVYLNDGNTYVAGESTSEKNNYFSAGVLNDVNVYSTTAIKNTITITREQIVALTVDNETVFTDNTVLSKLMFGLQSKDRSVLVNIDSIVLTFAN